MVRGTLEVRIKVKNFWKVQFLRKQLLGESNTVAMCRQSGGLNNKFGPVLASGLSSDPKNILHSDCDTNKLYWPKPKYAGHWIFLLYRKSMPLRQSTLAESQPESHQRTHITEDWIWHLCRIQVCEMTFSRGLRHQKIRSRMIGKTRTRPEKLLQETANRQNTYRVQHQLLATMSFPGAVPGVLVYDTS